MKEEEVKEKVVLMAEAAVLKGNYNYSNENFPLFTLLRSRSNPPLQIFMTSLT
jgi:hypothetical protein